MNFSFFIARRFFTHSEARRKASTPAIRIATAGVAIGLAVMVVSVCVVRGFQREVAGRITGFASDIEVIDPNYFNSPEGSAFWTYNYDTKTDKSHGNQCCSL